MEEGDVCASGGDATGKEQKRRKGNGCGCIINVPVTTRYHVSLRNYYYTQLPSANDECTGHASAQFSALV